MQTAVIGVMGVGAGATSENLQDAYELGEVIALNHWNLLTGGRPAGVMEAASRGAKSADGLTIGILPGGDRHQASEFVDIVICTGVGHSRNNINVLSSDVVIAVGMGMGTAFEVALAIKNQKPVILLKPKPETLAFFQKFAPDQIAIAETVDKAISLTKSYLSSQYRTKT